MGIQEKTDTKRKRMEKVQSLSCSKGVLITEGLALVANRDMHLEKMDVKTTFLRGNLDERISMEQSEGFRDTRHDRLVCKSKRSL